MSSIKSFFLFTRRQRNGVLSLLGIIVAVQLLFAFVDFSSDELLDVSSEEILWLQQKIDSATANRIEKDSFKIYPFNPNYIDTHKGYMLGMSVEEITRLHQFRQGGKWVNSATEFQRVTQINDSLLQVISSYFKFPERVTTKPPQSTTFQAISEKSFSQKRDLNSVTSVELREITGVGAILSERIVKYRSKLNGFLADEQLYDVYGLKPEVIQNILREFTVKEKPEIQKINVNTASASDLATIPGVSFELAKNIIDFRLLHETVKTLEDLKKVPGFPLSKFERITLYLTLE